MRKLSISCAALLLSCCTSLFAQQTGVNTKKPQGALHVDSKKNNATNGTPTSAEAEDDFIVDANGKVGIGILNLSTKLHIKSATAGAIRIVDGRQGTGKLLVSNANGVGTWLIPAVTRASVEGVFPAATAITPTGPYSDGASTVKNNPQSTGQTITLGPGKWVVSAGIVLESNPDATNMGWGHAWLSTSSTSIQQVGFTHLGPALNNTTYAGVLYGNFLTYTPTTTPRKSFISGSSLIEVTGTSNVIIYLLLERLNYTYRTNALQNYFYAVPIN